MYYANANPVNESNANVNAIVRHLRKPVVEIKKFAGNILQYKKFIRQFSTIVLSNTEEGDYDEKMFYLEQYTSGDAHRIVQAYSYLDSEAAFTSAWKDLERKYGNKEEVASAFVRKALEWPAIKPDNPKGLEEFATFLAECQNAVGSMDGHVMNILNYQENLKNLVAKLPIYLMDRWRTLVYQKKDKGDHQILTLSRAN